MSYLNDLVAKYFKDGGEACHECPHAKHTEASRAGLEAISGCRVVDGDLQADECPEAGALQRASIEDNARDAGAL